MSKVFIYCSVKPCPLRLDQRFSNAGHRTATAITFQEAVDRLDNEIFDILIIHLGELDADLALIAVCRDRYPTMPIVAVSSPKSRLSAVQAREYGVVEYLKHPADPDNVLLHTEKALDAAKLRAEHAYLIEQVLEGEANVDIVGKSPGMSHVRTLIAKVSRSRSNVLLAGESGTGKELVAQAIHQTAGLGAQPLIKVNCPGIPAQLFESELFGHMKGSFTGAFESRKGKFELAGKGNILLDEISELPLDLQAKLLRVLESRRFTRIGGTAEIEVHARVIAATNRDLSRMVKEGRFREDLFYRLNVFPISLPPLRARKPDIMETALHLLSHIGRSCGLVAKGIDKDAMKALEAYHWPGNVRELRNILERALVLAGGGIVGMEHLPWEMHEIHNESGEGDGQFNARVEAYKKKLLLEALVKNGWIKKEAARTLGLTQRAFSHYVARFVLDKCRSPGGAR